MLLRVCRVCRFAPGLLPGPPPLPGGGHNTGPAPAAKPAKPGAGACNPLLPLLSAQRVVPTRWLFRRLARLRCNAQPICSRNAALRWSVEEYPPSGLPPCSASLGLQGNDENGATHDADVYSNGENSPYLPL